MSELPAIDAMIDEGICRVREMRERGNVQVIEDFLTDFIHQYPDFALLGTAYYLGMLVVTRSDCYLEENDLNER
jgi:hypothetical protein